MSTSPTTTTVPTDVARNVARAKVTTEQQAEQRAAFVDSLPDEYEVRYRDLLDALAAALDMDPSVLGFDTEPGAGGTITIFLPHEVSVLVGDPHVGWSMGGAPAWNEWNVTISDDATVDHGSAYGSEWAHIVTEHDDTAVARIAAHMAAASRLLHTADAVRARAESFDDAADLWDRRKGTMNENVRAMHAARDRATAARLRVLADELDTNA